MLLSAGTFPGSVEAGDRRRKVLPEMTRHSGPNDVLHVACIGMGIMGYNDTDAAIKVPGMSVVTVCDLYSGRLTCIEANFDRQSAPGAWEYTLPTDEPRDTVNWDRYIAGAPLTAVKVTG